MHGGTVELRRSG